MASDISTVKSTIVTDGVIASAKGSAQSNNAGINFADIIRNNGVRVDGGLNALSERTGLTGVGERPDNPPVTAERPQDSTSDDGDNSDSRAEHDDHSELSSDRDVSRQSERNSGYDDDHSQNINPGAEVNANDSRDNSQQLENNGENAARNDRSNESSGDDTASSPESDGEGSVAAADGEDGEQATAKGENENGNVSENKDETKSDAKQMLNTLLVNAEAAALPGQASSQANGNSTAGNAKVNASDGLNTAIANVGKQADGEATNTGQSTANSGNTQTQKQAQILANSSDTAKVSGEAQAKDTMKAADQAAQISKLVGPGNKVEVSVTVTNEKSTLISKPSANLATGTVLAADSSAPSLHNKQAQANSNAGSQGQAQQAASQAAGATNQAQQAVQQAASGQGQSANAAAIGAKGAVQGALHTGASQTALSGNGETPVTATTGSTTTAQQAQANTSAQAANSARFTTANPALTDQVSVQISKAINAGNDKILIQLKPAEMGRVDVQMEVSQDGRVTAVVSADNKSTLDLLQKDAKELQQALQQAGLQVDNESLSFNLREQGEGNEMAGNSANGGEQGNGDDQANDLSLEEELAGLDRDIITDTTIDVRA
jgi:flagellar hook-length control protein FliK